MDGLTTPLDLAHAAMTAAPDDDAARLAFYARLADGEMFVLLDAPADGDAISPRVFDLEDGPVVLIFDREERLAAFAGEASDYAALPGRAVAAALAGQGVGIGVNLGDALSAMMLPPDAVEWLAATAAHAPTETEAMPEAFERPSGLPERLLTALDAKLARAAGLAEAALLARVRYADGRQGHMLAFIGAAPGAETALARASAEALTFSGVEAGEIDVTFLAAGSAAATAMAAVALRFDLNLQDPVAARPFAPDGSGTNPSRPPKLR